jgi:hypothetical protein
MPRKSFQSLGKIYFWTATIHQWKYLLLNDEMKNIIIASLQYLTEKKLIVLYAYVIMIFLTWLVLKSTKKNHLEAMQNEWKRKNQCQFFKIHRT